MPLSPLVEVFVPKEWHGDTSAVLHYRGEEDTATSITARA